jgi:hypothetical protein
MIVTAWNNGGTGYGIKVTASDRNRFFKKQWKSVTLEFENSLAQAQVNIAKKSFWTPVCRELIKKEIGEWFQANGLDRWPEGDPPKLWLEPLDDQRFLLRRRTPNDR